jgi:hypothetical protein
VVDVRFFHHRQELSGIRGQGLDVAALAFGVQRIERKRRLSRTGQTRDDDELIARNRQVEILQIVGSGPTQRDAVH